MVCPRHALTMMSKGQRAARVGVGDRRGSECRYEYTYFYLWRGDADDVNNRLYLAVRPKSRSLAMNYYLVGPVNNSSLVGVGQVSRRAAGQQHITTEWPSGTTGRRCLAPRQRHLHTRTRGWAGRAASDAIRSKRPHRPLPPPASVGQPTSDWPSWLIPRLITTGMTSRPPPPDVIARRVSGPRARDVATRRASVAVMTVHAGVRGPDLLGCDAKLARYWLWWLCVCVRSLSACHKSVFYRAVFGKELHSTCVLTFKESHICKKIRALPSKTSS